MEGTLVNVTFVDGLPAHVFLFRSPTCAQLTHAIWSLNRKIHPGDALMLHTNQSEIMC